MSNDDLQELTAAEAGINTRQQLGIVLLTLDALGGEAGIRDLYYAVERYMHGAVLSQQGRDTLRSIINREGVEEGLIEPYARTKPMWRISTVGHAYLKGIREELAQAGIAPIAAQAALEVVPEGIDNESFDLGSYPIDNLLIRTEPRTVFDVMRRIRQGMYLLDPEFQRDFVWNEIQQSKLIESTLMRIPLPVFYLAETDDGKVIVVDGRQRLTTFQRFIENEFALRGLGKDIGEISSSRGSEQLNGRYFDDLPPKLKNRIEDTQLILYLIDAKVPERARLDIFDRVNSGVPLSRQQMRNSLYTGKATAWLREQAESQHFLEATGGGLNSKTMRDREAINRFCAFQCFGHARYHTERGDMDSFLAETLKHINAQSEAWISRYLTEPFQRSMINNSIVFGRHAFRKHKSPDESRNVLNIALFDIYSTLMTRYSSDYVQAHRDEFYEHFFELLNNEQFLIAITNATNSVSRVDARFELITEYHRKLPADMEHA